MGEELGRGVEPVPIAVAVPRGAVGGGVPAGVAGVPTVGLGVMVGVGVGGIWAVTVGRGVSVVCGVGVGVGRWTDSK